MIFYSVWEKNSIQIMILKNGLSDDSQLVHVEAVHVVVETQAVGPGCQQRWQVQAVNK